MERIDEAIARLWKRLWTGEKIDIRGDEVEHPEDRPDIFVRPSGAWPVGQTCDHVWRRPDGTRIHAQCVSVAGRPGIRIHLDRFDPDHSIGHLIMHGLTETPIGPMLAVVAVALAVGAIAES